MRRQFRLITYMSLDLLMIKTSTGNVVSFASFAKVSFFMIGKFTYRCTLIHFKHKLSNEGFNKQLCIEQGVEQIILTCHIHKFPEKININISLLFKLPVT